MKPIHQAIRTAVHPAHQAQRPVDRNSLIGELIRDSCQLTESEISRILTYQVERGGRFGEAAVALGFVTRTHILEALSRQYRYPYTPYYSEQAHYSELVMAAQPFGEQAEAFRDLRSELMMGVMEQPNRALAVLSPDTGDGKTYVAANLAIAFSQLGRRTLLIDADMRAPRQHKILGIEPRTGLSSVLSGRSAPNVVHQVTHLPGLHFLDAGPVPPNPLELLQQPDFGRLMDEMLHNFDHVIVDTPAAVRGADGRLIATKSGAALVIGRRGHTRLAVLQALLSALAKSPARLAGVLLNEH